MDGVMICIYIYIDRYVFLSRCPFPAVNKVTTLKKISFQAGGTDTKL